MANTPVKGKFILGTISLIGWFSLFLQFYLLLDNSTESFLEITIQYFSYYTIITNFLLTIYCSVKLFANAKTNEFYVNQSVAAGITVHILVVCLIYNTLLRNLGPTSGLQAVVNEILHAVNPILYLMYWLIYCKKDQLQWNNLPKWLLFPTLYFLYTLIKGEITSQYPYPFIDVQTLGYPQVGINCLAIGLFIAALGLLIIKVGKVMTRRKYGPEI